MSIMDSIEERYEDQIAALTESRDHWKRQWRLMEAAEKKAEEEIDTLTTERDRQNDFIDKVEMAYPEFYEHHREALRGGEVKDYDSEI